MTVAAIETQHLTKLYGTQRGIVDVDLRVEQGEVFGFLGPNGAGKTTTIRVLMDLLRATSGTARVLGLDSRVDSVEIHRRVGYVPGDPALYGHLTAAEQLEWVADMRGGVDHRVITGLADRLDLDLASPIRSLSRGNRQKVALALAFLHRPDLLLLDEPTSGLDPLVQEQFHRMVGEVVADGRTVFLSSHVLDEVDHLCQRVGIIRGGRLVAVEDVAGLRNRAGRDVTVRVEGALDLDALRRADGVRDVSVHGDVISLHVSGDIDPLLRALASCHVIDLVSTPPELEDIFLGFYEDDAPFPGTVGEEARRVHHVR